MSEAVKEDKKFVIKHVFKNFKSMERHKYHWTPAQIHYNVPWRLGVELYNDDAHFHLKYDKFQGADVWLIEFDVELKFISKQGKDISYKEEFFFTNTDHPSFHICSIDLSAFEDYMIDGNVTVECHVTINNMSGVKKEKLINFDESMKEFSDVVLVVKGQKFYVIKKFLAFHSSYFKSMFSGSFNESENSEIELKEIDPDDFQIFLELIHGESVIDADTIDGLLHLADFFYSKIAMRRCEDFLLNKSQKSLTEKFAMAVRYNLEKIMEVSVSEIKTPNDIRSITTEISKQVEDSVWKVLLLKLLDIK